MASRTPLTGVSANRKVSRDALNPSHPVPSRVGELGRKEGNSSRSGSEADSLLDLYGRSANASSNNVNNIDNDIPENMYRLDDDHPEGWIHRDKLAKIESEELQAAGISLPTAKRAISKGSRKASSIDRTPEENSKSEQTNQKAPGREEKRQRVSSPVEEEKDNDDRATWDLRSPTEIAAEQAAPAKLTPSGPVLRKSGSRIPVLSSSPLAVPQDHTDRETPLSRSRATSAAGADNDERVTPKTRARGDSSASQAIMDETEPLNDAPSPDSNEAGRKSSNPPSPSKSKNTKPSAGTQAASAAARKGTPAARKTSATASKPPANSTVARPGTRSGEPDRPKTAVNRPESDPPWLATMYKPDPRLPPDQQIIPTHAKRQLQQQWTEEGVVPSTYDREFSPLAVHTFEGLLQPTSEPAPTAQLGPESEPENGESKAVPLNSWPLKPMLSVRSNGSTGRPGSSGSGTGAYSTVPKTTTPPTGTVQMQSPHSAIFTPRIQEQRTMPAAEEKKESLCGCCTVM